MFIPSVNTATINGPRSPELARDLFTKWNDFKKGLFAEFENIATDGRLNQALNAFYYEVYEQKPNEIDAKVQELFPGQKFSNLEADQKRKILWSFLDRLDPVYDKAFKNLRLGPKANLLKGLAYHIGTQRMRDLKPCLRVETEVDKFFRDRIQKDFKLPPGIEFYSSGSSYALFYVNHETKPYLLKLALDRDTKDIQRINKVGLKLANIERDTSVVSEANRKHLQVLAKADNDIYLGLNEGDQDGAVATEYLPGIALDATVQVEDLNDYVTKDLNIESLVGFIETVFRLTRSNDLSALAHTNIVYNPENGGELSLINSAGPATTHYNQRREYIRENPLRFTLYKLISDIVLIQADTAQNLREKIVQALTKTGSNIDEFMVKRFQLLVKALEKVFALNIEGFSKLDVKRELRELVSESDDKLKELFGPKLGLSNEGRAIFHALQQRLFG